MNFTLPLSISHSLNTETEPCLELDPIEEVKVASLEHLSKHNIEDDVELFLEEEDEPLVGPKPLEESIEPLNFQLSLNLCLPVLDMLFLIMMRNLL
jgi:hypothetical protein